MRIRKSTRQGVSHAYLLPVGILLLVCILFAIRFVTISVGEYEGLVTGADMVTVSVIDHEDMIIRTVTFDGTIESPFAFEYGIYPIKSVFRLDRMDGHDGLLAMETASLLVGVPVTMAIFPDGEAEESDLSPEKYTLRRFMRFEGREMFIRDIKRAVSVWRAFRLYRKEEPVVFTASDTAQIEEDVLKTVDRRLKRSLTLSWVLREALTVNVINASGVSGEGTRMGRMLSQVGFAVTSIDSSDEVVDTVCILRTGSRAWDTKGAAFLSRVFFCRLDRVEEPMTADMELIIGKGE